MLKKSSLPTQHIIGQWLFDQAKNGATGFEVIEKYTISFWFMVFVQGVLSFDTAGRIMQMIRMVQLCRRYQIGSNGWNLAMR